MEFPAFSQFIDIIEEARRGAHSTDPEHPFAIQYQTGFAVAAVKKLYPNLRRIKVVGGTPEEGKLAFEIESRDVGTIGVVMEFQRSFRSRNTGRWVEVGKYRI
jgi:hypothetical protein